MSELKNILVTGGAGFIGSNFIPYMLEKYENYRIITLDALTYAGSLDNLADVMDHPRFKFIKGSICNKELVAYIFKEFDIRGVFHFAAESHVDNSIESGEVFIETNVMGTFNMANNARIHWMLEPGKYKPEYEGCRFHHVSTDEVYGTLGEEGFFTETTPYAPNPPYAASKAGADFVMRSHFHTYGMNVTMSNCSNNYGPHQHDEKLIPTVIRKALSGENIPIYGNGKNIRDWLFVLDHCKGLDTVYHTGKAGETYNIGGWNERDNNFIANMICEKLDELKPLSGGKSYKDQISYVKDRAGHDIRYAIDPTKIENELGWKHEMEFEPGMMKTIEWYIEKYTNKKVAKLAS